MTRCSSHPRYEQGSRSVPCDGPGLYVVPPGCLYRGNGSALWTALPVCLSRLLTLSLHTRGQMYFVSIPVSKEVGTFTSKESDGRLAANPALSCLMNYIILIRWPVACLSTYTNHCKRPVKNVLVCLCLQLGVSQCRNARKGRSQLYCSRGGRVEVQRIPEHHKYVPTV